MPVPGGKPNAVGEAVLGGSQGGPVEVKKIMWILGSQVEAGRSESNGGSCGRCVAGVVTLPGTEGGY